jgi:transposase
MNAVTFSAIPDALWDRIEPLFSRFKRKRPGGSPQTPFRVLLARMLYRLKTGCQWSMIPKQYGSKTVLHEHYQRWVHDGVFAEILRIIVTEFHDRSGFDFAWQAMDGSLIQAPVRKKEQSEGIGANPTDRGRSGSKIHLHVDKNGTPLGAIVVGANIHDSRLVGATFEHIFAVFESQGTCNAPDNLCLDKGYDFARVRTEVQENGLQPHIRSRGEEIKEKFHPVRRAKPQEISL